MKTVPWLLLAAAPLAAAQADTLAQEAPFAGTRLEINATGEAHRTPDVATVSAGVVTQAGGATRAMADNAARMAATVAALKRAGVADRDIQTQALRLQPQYRYGDNQPPVLTGYQAANNVAVRLRDIARAGAVIDALVAAGANQIDGPSFTVDKPEAALDEARAEALAKARARADLYAKAAGLRVVRIARIVETGGYDGGRGPIVPMIAMAKRADTAIEPGEATLSANLQVTFELQ